MAEQDRANEADRFAHGTGRTETHEAEKDGFRPGEYGGGQRNVPGTGTAAAQGEGHAEGAEGAVGEMDFTGAPAGPGGSSGPSGGSAAAETPGASTRSPTRTASNATFSPSLRSVTPGAKRV